MKKPPKGIKAGERLQFALLTGPQLEDTLAALSFLKTVPGIDPRRIAVVGHWFGGQLTILAVERDKAVRAVVTFGAAANSWAGRRNCKSGSLLRSKRRIAHHADSCCQ
jgi:dienelactone hydrolase